MFDELISEKLIEWIWIVASIGVVIFGLVMLFSGGGFLGFLVAIIYTAMGLLLVRLFCESMLIAFKMYENNRRSLEVMEQMSRDQAATRQSLQLFLAQASVQSAGGAVATAAQVPVPSPDRSPASAPAPSTHVAPTLKTASKPEWESSYASAASTDAGKATPPSQSRLGEWPGHTSG